MAKNTTTDPQKVERLARKSKLTEEDATDISQKIDRAAAKKLGLN